MKSWFAKSTEVPGLGVVRGETAQEMAGPQGKISVTQSIRLLRFGRPSAPTSENGELWASVLGNRGSHLPDLDRPALETLIVPPLIHN